MSRAGERYPQPHPLIPRPRRGRARMMASALLVLCLVGLSVLGPPAASALPLLLGHFLALHVGQLAQRVCGLAEELGHVRERYQGSYWRAALSCLGGSVRLGTLLLLCTYFHVAFCPELDLPLALTLECLCHLLSLILGLQPLTPAEISEVCEKRHLNVAQGLAWSYYIGYLKLILPVFPGRSAGAGPEFDRLGGAGSRGGVQLEAAHPAAPTLRRARRPSGSRPRRPLPRPSARPLPRPGRGQGEGLQKQPLRHLGPRPEGGHVRPGVCDAPADAPGHVPGWTGGTGPGRATGAGQALLPDPGSDPAGLPGLSRLLPPCHLPGARGRRGVQ
ncbi:stimulator of interferon genes protein isoform X2 [Tachyglossus aculeatus]|uniref:stimulator of interferon genes protein isoform X2 n=1 Tax=Tachyglossus aculeatus TaxID=9261 RepID=UPI0018F4EE27|nr:stimulator of interferon genes protein isoform X2 [Tachyglossus aculeatus]